MLIRALACSLVAFGVYSDDRTVLSWTRSTKGCGEDLDIPNAISKVIWAVGPDKKKPKGDDDKSVKYHSHRGGASVGLRGNYVIPDDVADADSFDLRIPMHRVGKTAINDPKGPNRTNYICGMTEMPEWLMDGKKRHLIHQDQVITPGNFEKVHHILHYACNDDIVKIMEEHGYDDADMHKPHACPYDRYDGEDNLENNYPKMPIAFQSACTMIFGLAAIGSPAVVYPPEAGLPLGKDYFKYIYYEYHYDNFDQKPFEDSSALRYKVTENLREYDMGVMAVGSVNGIKIPAQKEAHDVFTRCPGVGGCLTSDNIGQEGITVTHSVMHGHLASRKIISNLVDESGKVLAVLGNEKYYDFNLQAFHELPTPVQVKPGQSIDVKCTYNTMDRNVETVGGLGTMDEMCLGFYLYYPALPMQRCVQALDDNGDPTNEAYCLGHKEEDVQVVEVAHHNVIELPEEECLAVVGASEAENIESLKTNDDADEYLSKFTNSKRLFDEPRFDLHWTYREDKEEVDFAVDVDTASWVGLGLTPNGDMKGADMMMGWVNDNGDVHMSDRFAEHHWIPRKDEIQSLWNMKGVRISNEDKPVMDPMDIDYSKECHTITDLIECVARYNCDALLKKGDLRKCKSIPCRQLTSQNACEFSRASGCTPIYKGKKNTFAKCK